MCTRNEAPTPALRFGAVYISTLGAPPSTHVTHAVRPCRTSGLFRLVSRITLLLNLERVRELGTCGACALNTPKALQRRAPAGICLVHSLRRKV